jgi:hypothetical protein
LVDLVIKRQFRPSVYLAGPIGGLTWDEAAGWRLQAKDLLRPCSVLSPLRDTDDGRSLRYSHFTTDGRPDLSNGELVLPFSELFKRDYMDCHTCDAMLINMIGAKSRSVGTICEIAWGYRRAIPMFLAMEPEGNVNDNPFLTPQLPRRFPTLADAMNALRAFYNYPAYDAGSAD